MSQDGTLPPGLGFAGNVLIADQQDALREADRLGLQLFDAFDDDGAGGSAWTAAEERPWTCG